MALVRLPGEYEAWVNPRYVTGIVRDDAICEPDHLGLAIFARSWPYPWYLSAPREEFEEFAAEIVRLLGDNLPVTPEV